jgi:hypothetical protein
VQVGGAGERFDGEVAGVAYFTRIKIRARWGDQAGRTAEVAGVELTDPYAVLLADETTEAALAWVQAIKAREDPETAQKRPPEGQRAAPGAFSRTDISIYEVLAGMAGKSSKSPWPLIRQLHEERFGAG